MCTHATRNFKVLPQHNLSVRKEVLDTLNVEATDVVYSNVGVNTVAYRCPTRTCMGVYGCQYDRHHLQLN